VSDAAEKRGTASREATGREPVRVAVKILDKDFHVACGPNERDALLQSAEHVNRLMREIRDHGKVTGTDRIAVMAALNIANELLQQRSQGASPEVGARLKSLRQRIETAMQERR
jgi:cell division protein ZapA